MAVHPDPSAPRRNRVRPDSELVAVPDRGLLWGNRGPLLGRDGELARYAGSKAWITCVLEFKGWHRTQWQPGRLTEIYFLDEATAFAAGHRPCGECRISDYRRYRDLWRQVHPGDPGRAPDLDARLQEERLSAPRVRRRHRVEEAGLPDGAVLALEDGFWLVLGDRLREWSAGGYRRSRPRPGGSVDLLTPPSTVEILRAGYRPLLHPSAAG